MEQWFPTFLSPCTTFSSWQISMYLWNSLRQKRWGKSQKSVELIELQDFLNYKGRLRSYISKLICCDCTKNVPLQIGKGTPRGGYMHLRLGTPGIEALHSWFSVVTDVAHKTDMLLTRSFRGAPCMPPSVFEANSRDIAPRGEISHERFLRINFQFYF